MDLIFTYNRSKPKIVYSHITCYAAAVSSTSSKDITRSNRFPAS